MRMGFGLRTSLLMYPNLSTTMFRSWDLPESSEATYAHRSRAHPHVISAYALLQPHEAMTNCLTTAGVHLIADSRFPSKNEYSPSSICSRLSCRKNLFCPKFLLNRNSPLNCRRCKLR